MPNVRRLNQMDKSWVFADNGDLIGFRNPNGTTRYFPAGQADNAITASTSSDQADAVQLAYRISRVTTVGTAGDSVKMPKALPGMSMPVINAAAANSMDVFPAVGEVINALSADAALALAANKAMLYTCAVAGVWNTNLTA